MGSLYSPPTLSYILLYYHYIECVTHLTSQCLRDLDLPRLSPSALSWPHSLEPKRGKTYQDQRLSRGSGPISRQTSSRTLITSNISLPTLKWNQSSARTKFVLLEWLNSSRPTCPTPRLDLDTSLDISLDTSLTGEISFSIKVMDITPHNMFVWTLPSVS